MSREVVRLAALLSRSTQMIAIPGTSSVAHLEANMAALGLQHAEDFDEVWLIRRKIITSLRKAQAIADLQRRLAIPAPTYSASDLPDWRPRRQDSGDH